MTIETLAMQALLEAFSWFAQSLKINSKRRQKGLDVMLGWAYNEPIKSRNIN